MHNITIGTKGEELVTVTPELAISFIGLDDARVLSTPNMILCMEQVCRNTLFACLDPGHDSVGTKVNVSHLKAAPIGATVTFTTEITAANDKRVEFHVVAKTADEVIGEGTHERAIIDVVKFAKRVAEKRQQQTN
jgi:fluoroacetyl-CoA thioesterase